MVCSNVDFVVMSGGGICDFIEVGDIIYKDVMKVQLFGNVLIYVDMNGKEVVDYLIVVVQMKLDFGVYLQFVNVSFVVKDGKLNDLKIKGELVDLVKIYWMVMLSFNVIGGDGYLNIVDKFGYVNIGFIDVEVLKEYIEKNLLLDVVVYELKGEVSWQ